MISDSQTSQDSSGSQIEEPSGPGFTSKFLQKWQIDFEPLFTAFLSIPHQKQPYSDLRHTLKYRFPKFWLKTSTSNYVFSRSKRRGVYFPPWSSLGIPELLPGGPKSVLGGPKSVPGSKIGPWRPQNQSLGDQNRSLRTPKSIPGGSVRLLVGRGRGGEIPSPGTGYLGIWD